MCLGPFRDRLDGMRRGAALVTSVVWFIITAGVGAVLVPWWLTAWEVPVHRFAGMTLVIGVVLIVVGLIPPIHGFAQFVRAGGTPMPGAITEHLVVTGFNRYVRNPIYLGVLTVFVGEAVVLWQARLLAYALAVGVGVAAFVHWYEERVLVQRFGADYEAYRRAVPAWLPRTRPWKGADRAASGDR